MAVERYFLAAWQSVAGIGPGQLSRLVQAFGSAAVEGSAGGAAGCPCIVSRSHGGFSRIAWAASTAARRNILCL